MDQFLKEVLESWNLNPDDLIYARFAKYCDFLLERNKVMNLTAIKEPDEVYRRHFADSLSILLFEDLKDKRVIDIGTGAGFPGLPLKIFDPSINLTMLDSLNKRVDFLKDTVNLLNLNNVSCIHARAEETALLTEYREEFDYALSRAVSELNALSELCLPYVKIGGRFIAMKSTKCDDELNASLKGISMLGGKLVGKFDYAIPNTDFSQSLVIIEKIFETPKKYPRRFAKIQKSPL